MNSMIVTDIFNKNINYIKKYRPVFYSKVKTYLDGKIHDFNKFNYIETKDKSGTIEIDFGQSRIRLNSIYSPKKEAEKWVNQFDFENLNVSVLMFGMANGIFARQVLKRAREDAIVVFFEPDGELFAYCLENFDMTDIIIDKRACIYVKDINDNEFETWIMNNFDAAMIPTQIVCSYPKIEEIYQLEAENFKKSIKQKYELEVIVNFSLQENYKLGIENILHNLKFIKNSNYSAELIGKVPNNVPVIIVSAGPSLDKNIDELKKAYGMAVILATDTAVKYLEKHKVKYDAIVSIDIIKDVKNLTFDGCLKHPIFVGMQSNYKILELNKGKKIWMLSSEFICRLYKKYGLRYSSWTNGGSVATDAFNLAKEFGTKRIVFVGQDLAFSGESTHAGDITDIDEYADGDIKYVEDIYGNKIKSRSDWVRYLYWFEKEIVKLNGEIDVIDATEGGAKIYGTKIMKLSDVIDKYCQVKFDFNEVIEKLPKTFSEQEYNMVAKDLDNIRYELNEIEDKANYGLKLSDEMLVMLKRDELNGDRENFCNKEIKKINSLIEEKLVYSIIRDYVETKIRGIIKVNCFTGNRKDDMIESYKLTKEAFSAIIEVVSYTNEIFSKII